VADNVKNLEWASKSINAILEKWINGVRILPTGDHASPADLQLIRDLMNLEHDLMRAFRERTT